MTLSVQNFLASADTPVLQRGGPSSSDLLNTIHGNILGDLATGQAKTQDIDRRQQTLSILLAETALGVQGIVAHLQSLLSVGAPSNRALVDFYSVDNIAASNTATIDTDYGQATLPVLSVQEKLHGRTAEGDVWVPEDSRLRTFISSGYTPGVIPPDDAFAASIEDYLGIGDQADSFFLGGQLTSPGYIYLKAELPRALNAQQLANRLTFLPLPAFRHTLVGAYVRDTAGNWNALDLSYLPGYTAGTVPYLGPTRLHFAPMEITQICLILSATGWWGVQSMSIQLVEYGPTASLAVTIPGASTLTASILYGKDPSTLNGFAQTRTGTLVQVGLSQVQAYSSPILTGVEGDW